MSNSDARRERARELLESYQSRLENHENLYETGQVSESLSTFFSGLAGKYKKCGILYTFEHDLDRAQEHFRTSATYYRRSAAEHSTAVAVLTTLPLTRGVYTAALAGDATLAEQCAAAISDVHRHNEIEPGDPHDDRFYFSGCLAGALRGTVDPELIEGLNDVNEAKPAVDALYGTAILEFSRGIRDDDPSRVETGIRSMLSYHEEQANTENIIDYIMAPEATALFVIAQWHGYAIPIEDDGIPDGLVEERSPTN